MAELFAAGSIRVMAEAPARPSPLPAPPPSPPPSPPPAPPPSFDGWGLSSSGWSAAVFGTPTFAALRARLGMRFARLVVPVDTFASFRDGVCDPDSTYAAPAPSQLFLWLSAAKAAHVTPLLSIENGHAAFDNLGRPLPGENNTTDAQYTCGLTALMEVTDAWAKAGATPPVTEWETYNEPDQGKCASTAAGFYADAVAVDRTLGRNDTLVAGAFGADDDPSHGNHPDCGHRSGNWYVADYVKALRDRNVWPSTFSLHPFDDVVASGAYHTGTETPQTTDTIALLDAQPGPHPSIWVTEVGVWLRARGLDHSGRMLGEDIDGNPLAQAWAAQGVMNLPDAAGQAYPGQIARVYYYELQTTGDGVSVGADHFDSALVGITAPDWSQSGAYAPASGQYAVPRASYCVLAYGDSPAVAVNDPRCDFAAGPNRPWTDWENPVHFPF